MNASIAPGSFRPTLPLTRAWLLAAIALDVVAGVQLFVLAEATATFFAWTIAPPVTAAFLGANYWAGSILIFLASRERSWARARIALYGVLAFTALMLAATLLHLDRFHLGGERPVSAVVAGWSWLVVYVVALVWQLAIAVAQQRDRRPDPPRQTPLPTWVRLLLAGQCALLVVVGLLLFAAPAVAAPLWPWTLTPLTARAVGSWLVGIGIVSGQIVWENDIYRTRAGLVSSVALGLLQLVVVARYADTLDWSRPAIWLYVLVAASTLPYAGLAVRGLARRPGATPIGAGEVEPSSGAG
ncbi:MAG: hypothetical protein IT340_05215 [Chloroflexi bacterium]|nr:hypothetical protein [Chloroflexota bacterium]